MTNSCTWDLLWKWINMSDFFSDFHACNYSLLKMLPSVKQQGPVLGRGIHIWIPRPSTGPCFSHYIYVSAKETCSFDKAMCLRKPQERNARSLEKKEWSATVAFLLVGVLKSRPARKVIVGRCGGLSDADNVDIHRSSAGLSLVHHPLGNKPFFSLRGHQDFQT